MGCVAETAVRYRRKGGCGAVLVELPLEDTVNVNVGLTAIRVCLVIPDNRRSGEFERKCSTHRLAQRVATTRGGRVVECRPIVARLAIVVVLQRRRGIG